MPRTGAQQTLKGSPARAPHGPGTPDVSPKMLLLRIASALLLIPLALSVVWAGGPVLASFIAIAYLILIYEWLGLVRIPVLSGEAAVLVLTALGTAVLAAMGLYREALGVLALGSAVAGLLGIAAGRDGFYALAAGGYLLAPGLAFLWLRDGADGLVWAYWLFAVVWTTDTGAFAAGRLIGGPAFAPHSSPNKTWAGLIGGIVLAGIAGTVAGLWFFPPETEGLRHILWLISLSATISLVTQAGDIFESGFKRHFGAKDSGRLIPGHGGLLDRLDGFLFAVMMLALASALRT